MKKILTFIAACAMTVMASAQNYEWTGPFGMPYVNLNAGAVSSLNVDNFDGFVKGIRPSAGIEFGTYFTPVWGASVEGIGFFGTTESWTLIDESAVLANGKLNFSNLLAGYKGEPRRVEVVGVLGYGWGHDYVAGSHGQYRSNEEPVIVDGVSNEVPFTDKNYTVYKAGAELNVNLGKAKAWQISVRPGVLWFHKLAGNYVSTPVMTTKRDGRAYVDLGVTYKFGNRKVKSHNFVTNTYDAYQKDYDALKSQYDELANREPEVFKVVKRVTETKEVPVETKVLVGSTIITFNIGSCELTPTEKAKVEAFAKSLDDETLVSVTGSADSKTGTETRNFALAKNRANVVKNALVGFGVAEDRIETDYTLDATENVLTSRSAIAKFK